MRKARVWLAVLLCALFVTVYSHTSSVSVSWRNFSEDSGDLLSCAYTLGIPHPTGYPLYVLLGRLFSTVMPGGVAFRITLLSVLAAALAPVFLFLTLARMLPGRTGLAAALAGALSLGFSLHCWSQAVVAEVYSLHLLFLSIVVYLVLGWRDEDAGRVRAGLAPEDGARTADRRLLLALYVLGLSFANHMLSVLTLVFVLIMVVRARPVPALSLRTVASCAGLFCAALTLYAYLPVRSAQNPELDWGNPETWSQFKWVVTGAQYHFRLLASPLAEALSRLWPGPFLAAGWPALCLSVLGMAPGRGHNRVRAALLAATILDLVVVAAYDIPDPPAYFLPACFALAVFAALGVARVASAVDKAPSPGRTSATRAASPSEDAPPGGTWRGTLAAVALLVACALPPALGNAKNVDASSDLTPYVFGRAAFRAVEPNALIVSEYDGRTFALWFFRETEFRETHARSVVAFKYLLAWPWYVHNLRTLHPDLRVPDAGPIDPAAVALVTDNLDTRPVYTVRDDPALRPFFVLKPVL
ncbi:MAG: DUF2723 domain-containing protein, partial [Candidatus Eisenbacteria bacterium]|nr:DUF2723 domain-containing protein [Candidatus Eisenbacteria bacterium]